MLVRTSSNNGLKAQSGLPSELANQDAVWSEVKYGGRSEIFGEAKPADYVYWLRESAVRTHKLLSDGRRQISAFHLPGDIFGVENGEVHRFTAEAIVDTTVWIANRRSLFAGLSKDDIRTAKNVRDLISRTLEHIDNHLRQNSLEKVAAFLAEMDRRLVQPTVIVLPMSRRDIADYLRLTLETVSRALSTLRDKGIISFIGQTHREIVLHNRAGLAQRANLS